MQIQQIQQIQRQRQDRIQKFTVLGHTNHTIYLARIIVGVGAIKMNTLLFVIIVAMVLLVYHQTVNGLKQHPLESLFPNASKQHGCMDYWNNTTEAKYMQNPHLCDFYLPLYHTYEGCVNHWKNDSVVLEGRITIGEICEVFK